MTLLFRRRIRVDRHLGVHDRGSDYGVWMRHGLWFLDDTGISRTRLHIGWRKRTIRWGRHRRQRWYRTDVRCLRKI